jgi:hypothetical protein
LNDGAGQMPHKGGSRTRTGARGLSEGGYHMPNEARHYFVYGNTAQGFISKLDSNLRGMENIFIIRGRPETGKAGFMSLIAEECKNSGLKTEYLHCPSSPDALDGIIVPDLKLAVIDGTDLHYRRLRMLSQISIGISEAVMKMHSGALKAPWISMMNGKKSISGTWISQKPTRSFPSSSI